MRMSILRRQNPRVRGATECMYELSQKEDDMYLSNFKKGAKLKLTSYKCFFSDLNSLF